MAQFDAPPPDLPVAKLAGAGAAIVAVGALLWAAPTLFKSTSLKPLHPIVRADTDLRCQDAIRHYSFLTGGKCVRVLTTLVEKSHSNTGAMIDYQNAKNSPKLQWAALPACGATEEPVKLTKSVYKEDIKGKTKVIHYDGIEIIQAPTPELRDRMYQVDEVNAMAIRAGGMSKVQREVVFEHWDRAGRSAPVRMFEFLDAENMGWCFKAPVPEQAPAPKIVLRQPLLKGVVERPPAERDEPFFDEEPEFVASEPSEPYESEPRHYYVEDEDGYYHRASGHERRVKERTKYDKFETDEFIPDRGQKETRKFAKGHEHDSDSRWLRRSRWRFRSETSLNHPGSGTSWYGRADVGDYRADVGRVRKDFEASRSSNSAPRVHRERPSRGDGGSDRGGKSR